MDRISVRVVKRKGRRFYQAEWIDPVTGRRRSQSTEQEKKRPAERYAVKIENEIIAGMNPDRGRITWKEFRERYTAEVLEGQSRRTLTSACTILNAVEDIIEPKYLAAVDSAQIGKLISTIRKRGRAETTIKGYLSHLRAALSWAKSMDLITAIPRIKMPKAVAEPKGRPITSEEFERMLVKVADVVQPGQIDNYGFLLRGLWFSGLRLGEALRLHWTTGNFQPELSGDHPMFWISAAGQKSRREQITPIAPEFAEMLESIDDRTGFVFKLPTRRLDTVSDVIVAIGKAANIKVADKSGRVKFASAQDLRRSFGARWHLRVMPEVLRQMMRHKSIDTTMKYYARVDADSVAAEIWNAAQKRGKTDTFTDTSHN